MKKITRLDTNELDYITIKFNTLRNSVNKDTTFSYKELMSIFHDNGIKFPTNWTFIAQLVAKKAIIKVGRGKYSFTSIPVHTHVINNIFADYYSQQRKYQTTRNAKPDNTKSIECENSNSEEEITRCIKILKDKGYKIYKPETTYNEI